MQSKDPVAILISDIHLSHKKPVCYHPNLNWYELMAFYLEQLNTAKIKFGVPLICSGDVFDKWQSIPELINFALSKMPDMLSIMGQHDMPNHNFEEREKSAFWTLVRAGKIKFLDSGAHVFPDIETNIYAYSWGAALSPFDSMPHVLKHRKEYLNLALVHKYIWNKKATSYPGASVKEKLPAYKKFLSYFDVALFGDNHKGFLSASGKCVVLNNGSMMRRKSDELDHKPCYGILYRNGDVKRVPFDVSKDRFAHNIIEAKEKEQIDISEFLEELGGLGEQDLDFDFAIKDFIKKHKLSKECKTILLEALEQ